LVRRARLRRPAINTVLILEFAENLAPQYPVDAPRPDLRRAGLT